MTASPAEVANDLEAQAAFLRKRDDDAARLCRDSARLIRELLAGQTVDGRTWGGVHRRLLDRCARRDGDTQIGKSLHRGLAVLTEMRAETS